MADFSSLKQTIQSYIKQNGNEEITGSILQDVLLAMVTTMGDSAINGLASALQDEITARQNQDATLQGDITAETTARQQADTALGGRIDGLQTTVNSINTKLAEGYIYAGIATPSTNPGTPSGKVFYIAIQAGSYTNFGGTVVSYGINILKYNSSAWSKDVISIIDNVPSAGSDNPVKSGGVLSSILDNNYNIFSVREGYINTDGTLHPTTNTKWITIIYIVDSSRVRLYGTPNVDLNYKSCSVSRSISFETPIATYDIPDAGYININLTDEYPWYYVAICYNYNTMALPYLKDWYPASEKLTNQINILKQGNYVDISDSTILSDGSIGVSTGSIVRVFKPIYEKIKVTFSKSYTSGNIIYGMYKVGGMTIGNVCKVVQSTGNISAASSVIISIPTEVSEIAFNDTVTVEPVSNETFKGHIAQDAVIAKYGVNIDQNGYIKLDGSIMSTSAFRHSDYIECYQGYTICADLIGSANAVTIAYYDYQKNYISSGSVIETSASGMYVVPDNPDICYVRFCTYLQRIQEIGYAAVIPNYRTKYAELLTIVGKPFDFSGKTALFVGDSITKGYINAEYTTPNPYCKLFCDAAGMTLVNNAVSGSTISSIGTTKSIPTQFAEADLTNIDYVFVAGGTNDRQLGATLDDFKTAVSSFFDNIVTRFNHPNSVFIITPINSTRYDATEIHPIDDYRVILTEQALMHQFNVINGGDAGFPYIEGDFARYMFPLRADGNNDYIHPSENGHKIYAKFLESVLM